MIPKSNMFRDRSEGEVPQDYDEASGTFVVRANGDISKVDIGKTAAIRDRLGGLVQNQVFDVAKGEWVIGSSSGGGSGGGTGTVLVDGTTIILDKGILKVIGVDGLTMSATDINNWLLGTDENIQTQLNDIKGALSSAVRGALEYMGTVPTYADLDIFFPDPKNGEVTVVVEDETKGGARTLYIYNGNKQDWQFVGNFEMADSFVKLTDTPDSYVGQAGKFVRVNSLSKGLEFIDLESPEIKDAVPTYTPAASILNFNSITGDDNNDGLSIATPKKDVYKFLESLNGKMLTSPLSLYLRETDSVTRPIIIENITGSKLTVMSPDPNHRYEITNNLIVKNCSNIALKNFFMRGEIIFENCPIASIESSVIDRSLFGITCDRSNLYCYDLGVYDCNTLFVAKGHSRMAINKVVGGGGIMSSNPFGTAYTAEESSEIKIYDDNIEKVVIKKVEKTGGQVIFVGKDFEK